MLADVNSTYTAIVTSVFSSTIAAKTWLATIAMLLVLVGIVGLGVQLDPRRRPDRRRHRGRRRLRHHRVLGDDMARYVGAVDQGRVASVQRYLQSNTGAARHISRIACCLWRSRGERRYSMMRREPVFISTVTAMPGPRSSTLVP